MSDPYLNRLLGTNERIVLVTRRHWLVLAGEILSESVLSLALIVLITLLIVLLPPIPNLLWAFGYLLLVFPLISMARDTAIWSNRKYVVTTRRVIAIEGVISKETTDSSLEKVNDVKLEQSFLGRLLDFGNLEILTASELGVNLFRHIASPIRFKTAMLNAKNDLEHPGPAMREAARDAAREAVREPAPREPAPDTQPMRRSLLEQAQEQRPADRPPTAGPAERREDIPALIRELDQLRQAGVLTEAEFQNKKAQLLSRL